MCKLWHSAVLNLFRMSSSIIHQYLFSYFNLIKVSSLKSTLEVYEEILHKLHINKSLTEQLLTSEISQINKIIQKYDLEIVETIDEISCEKLYILINTANNLTTQKSKFYDENTYQFFSKIIKDCILSEDGQVSETHCVNLSSQVKMSKCSTQSVLERLIADKWLVSMNCKISLSMRTITELEQIIKQYYPDDIKNCHFCKLIVLQGYICNNCKLKCHNACLKKYVLLSKSNCICPHCKEVWDDTPFQIKTEVPAQFEEATSSNTSPPKKKKKKFLIHEDYDKAVNME